MSTQSQPTFRASLLEVLTEDHERLERLFVDLLAALNADARDDAARLWSEFDTGLCWRMALEERSLLPAFRETEREEANALLLEHEQIRSRSSELGVGLDLHLTRADVMADFLLLLRTHARREDALLYRWAARKMPHLERAELGQAPVTRREGQLQTPAAKALDT